MSRCVTALQNSKSIENRTCHGDENAVGISNVESEVTPTCEPCYSCFQIETSLLLSYPRQKMQDNDVEDILRDADQRMPASREVFLYFLLLGFINVGGPVAQITMMYNHMVERRQWLSKDRFVHVMGFCHMLPGPEALQLAIYVGYLKRGLLGGVLAGLTFILPRAGL